MVFTGSAFLNYGANFQSDSLQIYKSLKLCLKPVGKVGIVGADLPGEL